MTEQRPPEILKLRNLVRRLRAPDGCPWDRKQSLESLRAYLLEEAHEVASAIDAGDSEALAEELGDLLFQVVFIAELAHENDSFDLGEVIDSIHDKMVARHPHVFGDTKLADARSVQIAWEKRKLDRAPAGRSLLSGIPNSLPALVGSYRLAQKAAGVGFDWPNTHEVMAKVREELSEVEEALEEAESPRRRAALKEELGDLLFSVANLARHLDIDPEAALAGCNRKFKRRFAAIEKYFFDQGERVDDASLEAMDKAWNLAKDQERSEKEETREP